MGAKQRYYGSREDFERRNPYVVVERDDYQTGKQQIAKSFSTRKAAENYINEHRIWGIAEVMTRRQFAALQD